jgi:hypothetical protein
MAWLYRVGRWVLCHLFDDHCGGWTCKAQQGIPPSAEDLRDGVAGFYRYATMYCRWCGKVSALNVRGASDGRTLHD